MTKRSLCGALAALLFAGFAGAQPPPQYPTGRTPPTKEEFLAHKSAALERHAGLVASWNADGLKATEPKWDSREHGWVPPIKNQGNCGSCWDFSGTEVAEVAFIKAGVFKADAKYALSEQYTLSCYENGGCNGDDNTTVLKHARRVGLPLTTDYGPYTAREGRCAYKPEMKLYKVDDWGFADGDAGYEQVGDTQKIKNAIKNCGIVGCAIAADNAFMNVRPGQVFHGNSRSINHDVALVGWDDEKKAWLLRNSWGNWCDGGYCWIAYGANQVGTEPVWALVNAPEPPPPPPVPPTPPPGPCPHYLGVHVGLWMLLVGIAIGAGVVFLLRRLYPPKPPVTTGT